MSKRFLLMLLVAWNVLLTAGLIWSHTRAGGARKAVKGLTERLEGADSTAVAPPVERDSAGLAQGRIAFFFMDSITAGYDLVKETQARVRTEGSRMEGNLRGEMTKAQSRAEQLASKDHTYSTQAEVEADQREFQGLQQKIQELQMSSQDRLDRLQIEALREITGELQSFLEEYNRTTGFDFIFSIQDEGQIWVGNKGLDISADVVRGLNERHRAKKPAAPAK
jgi:Skp family chaperone for outer membrane proteins